MDSALPFELFKETSLRILGDLRVSPRLSRVKVMYTYDTRTFETLNFNLSTLIYVHNPKLLPNTVIP